MTSERTLIASVVFLGIGLGLIFGYMRGSASFSAGYPISATSLQVSVNTTGVPAMAGFASMVLGVLLLAVALAQAILRQIRPRETARTGDHRVA